MPDEPKKETTGEQDPTKELKREFHIFEKISLVVNVVLALTGIGVLYIYGGQLAVMKSTLEEMRNSGSGITNQTNQLIGNMNWLARTMEGALAQTRVAMEVNGRQAKDALDASIRALHVEQRPYLIVSEAPLVNSITGDQNQIVPGTIKNNIRLTNIGKSPAKEVVCYRVLKLVPLKIPVTIGLAQQAEINEIATELFKEASVITSKPATHDHLKTGQRTRTQDMNCCTAPTGVSARTFWCPAPNIYLAGAENSAGLLNSA